MIESQKNNKHNKHNNFNFRKILPTIWAAILFTFSSVDWNASVLNKWDQNINQKTVFSMWPKITQDRMVWDEDYTTFSSEFRSLDSNVLAWKEEIEFFKWWLKAFSFIDVKFIDRNDFNNLKWEFLEKASDWVSQSDKNVSYKLRLPKDLKIWEIPGIVKRVNHTTFWDTLPEEASYEEMKRNIESSIIYILSLKTDYNKSDIQKSINKYYKLYQTYFPWENPRIDTTGVENKDEWTYEFKSKIENIDRKFNPYWVSLISKKIDNVIANNFYNHFFEAFFEHWTELLSDIGNLKEEIGISDMKKQLDLAKKSWNKYTIAKKEKEIVKKILSGIHDYWFQTESVYKPLFETSIPTEILKTKEITCVWFSIISDQFLGEVWISYNVLISPWHSSLSVTLSNGKQYLFDPLSGDELVPYVKTWVTWWRENISYNIDGEQKKDQIIYWQDSENILINQILWNKEHTIFGYGEESLKKKLYILERSIAIFDKNPFMWYNTAYVNEKLWNNEKALIAINKAINLNPKNAECWSMKAVICLNLDDLTWRKFAKNMYEKLVQDN